MDTRKLSVAFRWLSSIGLLAILGPLMSVARGQDVPPLRLPVGSQRGCRRPGRSECRGHDPRAGTRGLCRARIGGPNGRHDRSQAAGRPDRRSPARHEARGPELGLDSRLLELGRRPPGFYLGQRRVARAAAGLSLDARLLAGRAGAGVPTDFRLLDACPARRNDLSSPAAAKRRHRAHQQCSGRELLLDPGPLAMATRTVTSGSRAIGRRTSPTGSGCRRLILGCPRGWVYVPGYWDYPLARRGLVFSPVYFAGPVAVYRPAICLDAGVFSVSLFCRPSLWPLLLRRLLRRSLRGVGHSALFLLQFAAVSATIRCSATTVGITSITWANGSGTSIWLAGTITIVPIRTCVRRTPWQPSGRSWPGLPGMSRPDIPQLRMARDVHEVSGRPGGVRLQAVSQAEHAQLHQAARETVRFGQQRQQMERQTTAAGGGLHGPTQPQRASLTNMPSFKSTQLPGAAAGNINPNVSRPAGSATVTGPVSGGGSGNSVGHPSLLNPGTVVPGKTNPGTSAAPGHGPSSGSGKPATGNPGSGNRGGRDHEKKPQALVHAGNRAGVVRQSRRMTCPAGTWNARRCPLWLVAASR